jgi:hypothetical protein
VAEIKWLDEDLNEVEPVEACKALLSAIEAAGYGNERPPESFVDWQSYARDRDKMIGALADGVVTVLKVLKATARQAAAGD